MIMQTCNPGTYFECSTDNCDYFCALENANVENHKCPNCEVTHCFKCRSATRHEGLGHDAWIAKLKKEKMEEEIKNAVEEVDESVNQWAQSAGAKRCTRCFFWVHKNEGCDHMTCRCGYQFCYICGGKYQDCECTRKKAAEAARQAAEAEARRVAAAAEAEAARIAEAERVAAEAEAARQAAIVQAEREAAEAQAAREAA